MNLEREREREREEEVLEHREYGIFCTFGNYILQYFFVFISYFVYNNATILLVLLFPI